MENGIIILGAGVMQIPAIESAKRKNLVTLVFDGSAVAPGKEYADFFEAIDLKDGSAILEKALYIIDKNHIAIKGVFTAGTDFSYMVAWLSEKLSLSSISYETALKATEKSKMRHAFKDAAVSSPSFIVISKNQLTTTAENFFKEKAEKGELPPFPLVVKPVDSMGGRGTVKVNSVKALSEAAIEAVNFSRCGQVIAEEYIEGSEFSLDAIIKNGEIFICGNADRHIFFPPYFVEMGHTMPSNYPEQVQKDVEKVFCQGIKAIGIENGAAKGDIKFSIPESGKIEDGKSVIGEIAARLSGGYMSGWTFPYSSDFSAIDAAIDIACNLEWKPINYIYKNIVAERAFISVPGIVKEIYVPDYLQKAVNGVAPFSQGFSNSLSASSSEEPETVKNIFINVKPGDKVVFPKNNVQKCGNVIAVHKKREIAIDAAEKACRHIIVKLITGSDFGNNTADFIFGEKENWIPDAFSFNKELLDSIPEFFLPKGKITFIGVWLPPSLVSAFCKAGKDWQGRCVEEALMQIKKLTGILFTEELPVPKHNQLLLGKVFWQAVSRATVQGGVWIVETLVDYISKNSNIGDIIRKDGKKIFTL